MANRSGSTRDTREEPTQAIRPQRARINYPELTELLIVALAIGLLLGAAIAGWCGYHEMSADTTRSSIIMDMAQTLALMGLTVAILLGAYKLKR